MKYNILIYGAGARENALADKILQSPLLNKLFLALPNDGFKNLGEEIVFDTFENLAEKCVKKSVDLAVIGPELPLAQGIVDILQQSNIKCIGANKFWTQLESSKLFAKNFMNKYNIPTAKYLTVQSIEKINSVINAFEKPPVIKAVGLAGGKGVSVCESFEDARKSVAEFLHGKFGDASKKVIVEERLSGKEISLISLFDGKTLLPLIPAQDYKRLFDGDKGPNTGGMGAFCPVDLTTGQNAQLLDYIKRLKFALQQEKADFCGIIYSGLILTNKGLKVLEFNMRFGDPETQVILSHLNSDLLEIFIKMTEQKLSEIKLDWGKGKSLCVVLAAKGYPQTPKTGDDIVISKSDCKIFFAGVKEKNKHLITSGGRILNICTRAEDINQAREKIYSEINNINFENKIFRTDIGL